MMKKSLAIIAFISLLLIALNLQAHFSTKFIKQKIMEIVANVEEFKKENNRLPESFQELGVAEYMEYDEGGPFYYSPYHWDNRIGYIVWRWGSGLGYDTGTKEWKDIYMDN